MFEKNWIYDPPYPPSTTPRAWPMGQIWKIYVFNFFYSSCPSIGYATWPCLTKLDIGPPLSPKYHPQGMTHGPNLKNIVFNFFTKPYHGQNLKKKYCIEFPLLFKPFELICYMAVFDKIGLMTLPPPPTPKYHPQGMTHGPNLNNIVFNFLYSSIASILYATWPCLTKLDFWPPYPPSTTPRAWPIGQIWKILYLISSTLHALQLDMLHDHVWQNWILNPLYPPSTTPRAWPMGQIWKILYLISSTLQALRFDMSKVVQVSDLWAIWASSLRSNGNFTIFDSAPTPRGGVKI